MTHPSSMMRAAPFLTLALLAMGTLALRSDIAATYTRGQRYEDVYYLPPDSWLKPLSLQYHDAAADFLWMKSLLYFGEEQSHRGQTRYVFDYIDAMLTLDPNFRAAYLWASVAGLYHSGDVTVEDGYRVVDYLERAIERWPDDGEFYWELGAALRFEMAPLVDDPVEKRRLYEAAMEPLATAARLGAGPAWLAGLNAQLLRKLGKTEQAIRHIEEMYDVVESPFEKEQLQTELIRLRSESYATAFQAANEDLAQARLENFPYLDSNFFLLVGPRVDNKRWAWLAHGFLPTDELLLDTTEEEEASMDANAAPEGAVIAP